ncbi:MAG: 2-succinyl-5-enolpyruvyl-6-hydroxy-3-cyclohexene-1-carboxylic-acid synthase, partial [Mycetocola sp.]
MPERQDSTATAIALLNAAIGAGVEHVVLSPGSRSQAIAFAAAAAERQGQIQLHVRIDERGAGFFALGIARETGVPALVVVTSGTAVANLFPAVLEASHARVPLLLVTADRPAELHGIRANQTTTQRGIFGDVLRYSCELGPDDTEPVTERVTAAIAAARGAVPGGAGPVQINAAFRDPLASALPEPVPFVAPAGAPDIQRHSARPAIVLDRGPRTVVIAGADSGPIAEDIAHRGGWPLLAEISSGSRFGRNLVVNYRELLRDPELGGRIERVVVFGHPTLSREIPALIGRDNVDTVVIDAYGADTVGGTGERIRAYASVDVAEGAADRGWLGEWLRPARAWLAEHDTGIAPDPDAANSHDPAVRLAHVKREFAQIRARVTREMLVDAVWRTSWPHDRILFGASRLIRVADATLAGKRIPVHANRGLSGIDGTVATGLGVAAALRTQQSPGITRVVLGDVTLLHDTGSLLRVDAEAPARIQVIVGDDGGGTIFDDLEAAALGTTEDRDRVLYTPHTVDLEALAKAYGWEYVSVQTRGALEQALTTVRTG